MSGSLLEQLSAAAGDSGDRIYGLVFAEVAAVDEDGYILRYASLPLTENSVPARVVTPNAGNERGMYFMPEVGDEVAVMFERGDLNQPVIIGALYSEQDRPPPQADTEPSNNVRTIVSRSGHEVTFDDTPGATKVEIRTQGGLEIVLQDTPQRITIKTAPAVAGSKIVLDGVSWYHQHGTGSGPTTGPISMKPVSP